MKSRTIKIDKTLPKSLKLRLLTIADTFQMLENNYEQADHLLDA